MSGMMEGRLLRLDRKKQSSEYSTESWHLKNIDTLGVAISSQQLSIKPSPLLVLLGFVLQRGPDETTSWITWPLSLGGRSIEAKRDLLGQPGIPRN